MIQRLRIRYTLSSFLTDLIGGSAIIALFTGHYEYALAGQLGLLALVIKDQEHRRRMSR